MRKIGAFRNLLVSYSQFKKYPQFGTGGYGPGHEPRGELTLSEDEPAEKCYYLYSKQSETELNLIDTFLFEVDCYASLQHPAVLKLLGYTLPVLDDEKCGFFFPDTSNIDLDHVLIDHSRKEISPTNQSIIIFGIAAGMAFVHQNNIFHRNLTPSNIVIDDNFHPKINNFHLSISLVEGVDNKINDGYPVGTPAYMAPEVLKEGMNLTNKTDVYSYGSVLLHIFTKKRPYSDLNIKNASTLMIKIISNGKPPNVKDGEVPPIFLDLIKRCWNSDTAMRPSFIQIVKEFMDRRNEFFSQPGIDMNELNNYITEVTKDLVFP